MMCVQWCYRSDREEDVAAKDIIAFDRQVTEEDREILESTDFDVCIDTTRRVEFHMETDKPGLIMRQKLLALFRAHGEDEAHASRARGCVSERRARFAALGYHSRRSCWPCELSPRQAVN